MNDIEGAKDILRQKRPCFERQFIGYAECLEAITNMDPSRFAESINLASQSWTKFASRTVKGLPDSVCFIQGVGLVRLAERVIRKPVYVSIESLPEQLLGEMPWSEE